jgi:hypothetical protein
MEMKRLIGSLCAAEGAVDWRNINNGSKNVALSTQRHMKASRLLPVGNHRLRKHDAVDRSLADAGTLIQDPRLQISVILHPAEILCRFKKKKSLIRLMSTIQILPKA